MSLGTNRATHPAASPFEWPQTTKNDLKTSHLLDRLQRLGLIASCAPQMSSSASGQHTLAWRARLVQTAHTKVIMLGVQH
jgi:hypothetical protein